MAMHARSMTFTAKAGSEDELAEMLSKVAKGLEGTDGLVSWLVARNPEESSEVWVQEVWESEDAAEAALGSQDSGEGPSPQDVMALCDGPPSRTDLKVVGGVGAPGGTA